MPCQHHEARFIAGKCFGVSSFSALYWISECVALASSLFKTAAAAAAEEETTGGTNVLFDQFVYSLQHELMGRLINKLQSQPGRLQVMFANLMIIIPH